MYRPSQLPEIDAIEVLKLGEMLHGDDIANADGPVFVAIPDAGFVSRVERTLRIDGDAAREVADLWRALPSGSWARCHIPPFGFRFFEQGKAILTASLCWKCNHAYVQIGEQENFFPFDANASISVALFDLLTQLTNEGSTTE